MIRSRVYVSPRLIPVHVLAQRHLRVDVCAVRHANVHLHYAKKKCPMQRDHVVVRAQTWQAWHALQLKRGKVLKLMLRLMTLKLMRPKQPHTHTRALFLFLFVFAHHAHEPEHLISWRHLRECDVLVYGVCGTAARCLSVSDPFPLRKCGRKLKISSITKSFFNGKRVSAVQGRTAQRSAWESVDLGAFLWCSFQFVQNQNQTELCNQSVHTHTHTHRYIQKYIKRCFNKYKGQTSFAGE
jgi:hypothetical protein